MEAAVMQTNLNYKKVGFILYIADPKTEFSYRLQDHNTVFQAEVPKDFLGR